MDMRKLGYVIVGLALGVAAMMLGRGPARAADPEKPSGATTVPVGAECRVYLRGDASGVAYNDRVADIGLLLVRKGTFVGADDVWVSIKGDNGRQEWIPRSAVALVQVP